MEETGPLRIFNKIQYFFVDDQVEINKHVGQTK